MTGADFWQNKNVVVTGGSGFLGAHLCDGLRARGCIPFIPFSNSFDLRYPENAEEMFETVGKVDILFNLAANVGGIGYNRIHPYKLFYDNISMGVNIINASVKHQVGKLVQVGTVCGYPKHTPSPFMEETFWDGYPEETNAPYGLAKKILLVQLQAARAEFGFNGIYLLPTNLYGPYDEFNPIRSHVIPSLIRKVVEAKHNGDDTISVWGTGRASRDFLYVRDCAEALLLAAEHYERDEPMNLGSGQEITIAALVHMIMGAVGYTPRIEWDTSKPDGQPRRRLNSNRARDALSWQAVTSLQNGLAETVAWVENILDKGLGYLLWE